MKFTFITKHGYYWLLPAIVWDAAFKKLSLAWWRWVITLHLT